MTVFRNNNLGPHSPPLHVVAKPAGPDCNLDCDYCFYLEKQALFSNNRGFRMSDTVLQTFIENYIRSQSPTVVEFVWQGGEPTLLGVEFFERVIELQRPFSKTKTIKNSLQTNGTLLTDRWCKFLKQHDFMVGISLDGPQQIHDQHRHDKRGKGTFDMVMQGLRLLQKHEVPFNVLACVSRESANHPLEIYQFFKDSGVEFVQFTPVVERACNPESRHWGVNLAGPAALSTKEPNTRVTPWSVQAEEYGEFLIAIYEDWVRNDVGNIFVMNFEWALNAWIGNPSPVCIHAQQCGRSLVVEHNGDVYACDHNVYPEFRLGNIATESLLAMVEKSQHSGFGVCKETALPKQCQDCDVLAACRGGCPKHRFVVSWDDQPGLQYLCPGYRKFFRHIRKYLTAMATLLENGLPASYVMDVVKGPLVVQRSTNKQEDLMQ
ncbi:MAG: anaerobic sulfatase maturase [Desulfuromonadales bacterium]